MKLTDFKAAQVILCNMEYHERLLVSLSESRILVLRLENKANHKVDVDGLGIRDGVQEFMTGWVEEQIESCRKDLLAMGVVP